MRLIHGALTAGLTPFLVIKEWGAQSLSRGMEKRQLIRTPLMGRRTPTPT